MDIFKMLGNVLEADTDDQAEETPPDDTLGDTDAPGGDAGTADTSDDDQPLGDSDVDPDDDVATTADTDTTDTSEDSDDTTDTTTDDEGGDTGDGDDTDETGGEDESGEDLTDEEINNIDKEELLFDRRVKTLNETVLDTYDTMLNFNSYLQTVDKLDDEKEFIMEDLKVKYNNLFKIYKIYVEEVFAVNDFHMNMITYRKFKIAAEIIHSSIRELLAD